MGMRSFVLFFSILFTNAACDDAKKVNKVTVGQPSVNNAGHSDQSGKYPVAATTSHLLLPPSGYVLITSCLRVPKVLLMENASELTSHGQAAAALLSNAAEAGKVSLCSERFAVKDASDEVRASIIEESRYSCQQDERFSKVKFSFTNPEPCPAPSTGEQTLDNEKFGPSGNLNDVKFRSTISISNLSTEDIAVLKRGYRELKTSAGEQRRLTPNLE